jgi:hypothetical protein
LPLTYILDKGSHFCLPCTWDYRNEPSFLAYLLRWDLPNFLFMLISNCDTPRVAKIADMSHHARPLQMNTYGIILILLSHWLWEPELTVRNGTIFRYLIVRGTWNNTGVENG